MFPKAFTCIALPFPLLGPLSLKHCQCAVTTVWSGGHTCFPHQVHYYVTRNTMIHVHCSHRWIFLAGLRKRENFFLLCVKEYHNKGKWIKLSLHHASPTPESLLACSCSLSSFLFSWLVISCLMRFPYFSSQNPEVCSSMVMCHDGWWPQRGSSSYGLGFSARAGR